MWLVHTASRAGFDCLSWVRIRVSSSLPYLIYNSVQFSVLLFLVLSAHMRWHISTWRAFFCTCAVDRRPSHWPSTTSVKCNGSFSKPQQRSYHQLALRHAFLTVLAYIHSFPLVVCPPNFPCYIASPNSHPATSSSLHTPSFIYPSGRSTSPLITYHPSRSLPHSSLSSLLCYLIMKWILQACLY